MKVGIVGARVRTDEHAIREYVRALPANTVVVSGGADGPDTWAVDEARRCGLEVMVCLPDLGGVRSRGEAAQRYFERNERIVRECDRVVAFVAPARKGGTENTIRHARRLGRPVELR